MNLKFLRKLSFTCVALAGSLYSGSEVLAQALLNPATQPRFVNQLTAPSVIDATNGFSEQQPLKMEIKEFCQDLGLKKPGTLVPLEKKTKVWGYRQIDPDPNNPYNPNNPNTQLQYPGPTIAAYKNHSVYVHWYNELRDNNGPLPHLLQVDKTIHNAYNHMKEPVGVPIVTHLHGGHTESASDGLPNAWYTPGASSVEGTGYVKGNPLSQTNNAPYHYANDQEAATIWYHDHALGITRLNVYAGLAGFYILTDGVEQNLKNCNKLPAAPYDLGLAIQDRLFTADGQLFYPTAPVPVPQNDPNATDFGILPEMFGNVILVNGKAWPVLEVEPRQYRFRLLNGSDSRFYNLFFSEPIKFWQIGSDLGFLPAPVGHDQLLLATGERKDVVVDFSNPALWGKTIIMRNNAKAPYPKGATPNPQNEGQIMAFRVNKPLNTTDLNQNTNTYNTYPLTPVPATLRPALPAPDQATRTRKLILFEGQDEYGRLKAQLGTFDGGAFDFMDNITEDPVLNATEIWEIYNLTPDAHPIHLHLVNFQVLSTQKFKPVFADAATGKLASVQLQGQPKLPEMGQRGLKDTYPIEPGEVARFIAKFDREGLYVWHCHILSHEDHDMMRPYYVSPTNGLANGHKTAPEGISAELKAAGNNSYQLYPNPFSAETTLHFRASEPGQLTVKIFDLKGRLVKEEVTRNVTSGEHSQTINSAGMSNGLYVCEIQLNGQVYRDRLVVAK